MARLSRSFGADLPVIVTLLALLLAPTAPQAAIPGSDVPRRGLVLDGSFVHDVGMVHLNITNWGLIGSRPGLQTSYSSAPSAEWPAGSGIQYIWASGLWIGALVDGVQPRVSTGQYETELLPDPDDPVDVIYRQLPSQPGSRRYPEANADDDADGLEDEDPIDGLDNDGDGAFDEDAGGIGDQHFLARMRDDQPLASDLYPTHDAMGLAILQETFQWSDPRADDFVGLRFHIENVGDAVLEDVYLGFMLDADIGSYADNLPPVAAEGDLPIWISTTQIAGDGTAVPVIVAGMYEAGAEKVEATGIVGVQFLGHETDPSGTTAPSQIGPTTFRVLRGDLPFDQGGDPTNDLERYRLMSSGVIDPSPPLGTPGNDVDRRILVAVGPFATLAPGGAMDFEMAIVLGGITEGLIENAATAWLVHRGQWFDRDGDPSTGAEGREFHVPWLFTADLPVPALTGALSACVETGVASLVADLSLYRPDLIRLVRLATASDAGRTWSGREFAEVTGAGTQSRWVVRDVAPVGWPRTYQLRAVEEHGSRLLDEITVQGPELRDLRISASPNPFNPRVTLRWAQPLAGTPRLRVFDAAGRLVRELEPGPRSAGEHTLAWDGRDAAGRAVASGVYHAEVSLGESRSSVRLTLVR